LRVPSPSGSLTPLKQVGEGERRKDLDAPQMKLKNVPLKDEQSDSTPREAGHCVQAAKAIANRDQWDLRPPAEEAM
jgi:hypothetical protein